MPQYEYICKEDGEVITLLRPMRHADKPVDDPAGKGRSFTRRHSTFMVSQSAASDASGTPSMPPGSGCVCGAPHGSCASMS